VAGGGADEEEEEDGADGDIWEDCWCLAERLLLGWVGFAMFLGDLVVEVLAPSVVALLLW